MKNSIWTEITAQRIRWTDRATFYRTNEIGDKVGCGARIHAFPTTLSLPSFPPPPPSPSPAQDWTACQWPELVPTHSHPGPTPLVLVSFSVGFIHPLVLSSLSRGTYQPTSPLPLSHSLYLQSLRVCISMESCSSFARCIFTRFSCFLVPLR